MKLKSLPLIISSLENIITNVPESNYGIIVDPVAARLKCESIISDASWKSATISGTTSFLPGVIGFIALLPDIVAVWKVQSQMVADIAAINGKTSYLTKESMIFCLFKHSIGQGLRDIVVRAGSQYIVKKSTVTMMQKVLNLIGIKASHRSFAKVASSWVPIIGSIAMGSYAKYDSKKVGETALEFFTSDLEIE